MTDKNVNKKNSIQSETIKRLEHEVAATNDRILYLQNELDQVSSLKMHIKHYTKKKLKNIDRRIEDFLQPRTNFAPINPFIGDDILESAHRADQENFDAFNDLFSTNSGLGLYRSVKSGVKRITENKKAS